MKTHFERAIFLSWYCGRGDCKFCYMSTQKSKIKEPRKARRSKESILAEAFLCKQFGWKIEFLSGGYEVFTSLELLEIIKGVFEIYGEKLWLNIGALSKKELEMFKPYIQGVCGTVECVNPKVQRQVCPSKPVSEILTMFEHADKLGLKKCITIVLGIGESLEDISLLINFIKEHNIDKITFYRLKPQKETVFENTKPITAEYYVEWVKAARDNFPKLNIVVGSWLDQLDEINLLLKAGANAVTKFPSIKKFGSKYAIKIEEQAKKAGRKFEGTLTKMPKISLNELDDKVKEKVNDYLKSLK
jgi:biotin synthase-like enzyme